MIKNHLATHLCLLVSGLAWALTPGFAQQPTYPFNDPSLSMEKRIDNLLSLMTIDEKINCLSTNTGVPRLGVMSYGSSEGIHGVVQREARGKRLPITTTQFPQPPGMGESWDPDLVRQAGGVEGYEARFITQTEKYNRQILMLWGPQADLARDPRWGRGEEVYGEDPFFNGTMVTAFARGLEGDDPKYWQAAPLLKHFLANSNEDHRTQSSSDFDQRLFWEYYSVPFRMGFQDGGARGVMASYNAWNGTAMAINPVLQSVVRDQWGVEVVSSDGGAVHLLVDARHLFPDQKAAVVACLKAGINQFLERFQDEAKAALADGSITEAEIDNLLRPKFRITIRLGLLDPPEMVPYTKIDEKELDSAEHRALAHRLANEAMVLLKNDGTLPLKHGIKKIAVVGPLADQTRPLLGNYAGQPTHIVSVLDGLRAEFPKAKITFVPGTQFLRNDGDPVPDILLTAPDGKPGLKADYGEWLRRPPAEAGPPPIVSRTEPNINLSESSNLPPEVAGKKAISVHWTGFLTVPESGEYLVGIRGRGFGRVSIDDKQVAMLFRSEGVDASVGRVHLEKGQKAALNINYSINNSKAQAQLIWTKVRDTISPEAIAAAKDADVVVAVVGITSMLEGEQMPVTVPGFQGGDRTSIDLPEPEESLVKAVAATGKPLAVVLINGSALAVNWINEHANAVLEAWYPGEEGGAAIAETLSGKNNPAGRLPVTFYTGVNQLPNFEDYGMAGRTYRYFKGKPLYPFGYGLSYTTFKYSNLSIPTQAVKAGQPVSADVTVTNTGNVAGDEVVEVYLKFPDVKGAPLIALRGFQRIHLEAGASQNVHFELKDRDLGMVTEEGNPIIAAGDYTISIGGGQPDTGAACVSGHFHIETPIALPE